MASFGPPQDDDGGVCIQHLHFYRVDMEKRIGMQLDQAIPEDILIASGAGVAAPAGQQHTLYDWDMVARIFSVFLNLDNDNEEDAGFDCDIPRSLKQSLLVKAPSC
jgi:hypothetical protein